MPSRGNDASMPQNDFDRMLMESLIAIDDCQHYNVWLASHFLPYLAGDIIEIGSGIGTLARYYDVSSVRSALLTDISPSMLRRLETRFGNHPKCKIRELDILMQPGLPVGMRCRFDCVISLNVLEHIDNDRRALVQMYELLRPGGRLLLFLPALPFLYGAIDKAAGHFRRYSKRGLVELTAKAGFVRSSVYYVNFFGMVTWLISSRLLQCKNISPLGCRVLDKLVPALRLLESGVKPPLGQSLVYIGKKPCV